MTSTNACTPAWASWVRLQLTPGLGPRTVRRLLERTGSVDNALSWVRENLAARCAGQDRGVAVAASAQGQRVCDEIAAWLDSPRTGEQHALWTPDHPDYPSVLREIPDPPLCLFLRGQYQSAPARAVAMVGSRNATRQGADNARAFAHALADRGWCVVSGLALGIDGAAHQGALASRQPCATLAVVGTGLDQTYPTQHRLLADEIASRGLLLSEFLPGTPPAVANFPRRNRIIAGLCRATVVVEASLRSGSLITASQALEQGRDVMAVPGSIHATQSRGCHALIKQGAKLVESTDDILVELQDGMAPRLPCAPGLAFGLDDAPQGGAAGITPPPAEHRAIWDALGLDPSPLETLCRRVQLETAQVLAGLLALELAGWIERLPGGRFQRVR